MTTEDVSAAASGHDRDDSREPSTRMDLFQHPLLVASLLLSFDLLLVASYQVETTFALLRHSGPISVLAGTLINASALAPLFAFITLVAAALGRNSAHWLRLSLLLILASLFVTPRAVLQEWVTLPPYQSSQVNTTAVLILSIIAAVGWLWLKEDSDDITRVIRWLRQEDPAAIGIDDDAYEQYKQENGGSPDDAPKWLLLAWRFLYMWIICMIVVFSAVRIFSGASEFVRRAGTPAGAQAQRLLDSLTQMWLTPEVLTLSAEGEHTWPGRQHVGYVLEVDESGRWVTVISEATRAVVVLDSAHIERRTPCRVSETDPRPLIALSTYKPALDPCPR